MFEKYVIFSSTIVREGVKTYTGCGGVTPFIHGFFVMEPCSVAGEKVERRLDTSAESFYRDNNKAPVKGPYLMLISQVLMSTSPAIRTHRLRSMIQIPIQGFER